MKNDMFNGTIVELSVLVGMVHVLVSITEHLNGIAHGRVHLTITYTGTTMVTITPAR